MQMQGNEMPYLHVFVCSVRSEIGIALKTQAWDNRRRVQVGVQDEGGDGWRACRSVFLIGRRDLFCQEREREGFGTIVRYCNCRAIRIAGRGTSHSSRSYPRPGCSPACTSMTDPRSTLLSNTTISLSTKIASQSCRSERRSRGRNPICS